jgi:hypothetical protein
VSWIRGGFVVTWAHRSVGTTWVHPTETQQRAVELVAASHDGCDKADLVTQIVASTIIEAPTSEVAIAELVQLLTGTIALSGRLLEALEDITKRSTEELLVTYGIRITADG